MSEETKAVHEWRSDSGRRYGLFKDTNDGHKICVWVERNGYWDYCRAAASQTVVQAFARFATENVQQKAEIAVLKSRLIVLEEVADVMIRFAKCMGDEGVLWPNDVTKAIKKVRELK